MLRRDTPNPYRTARLDLTAVEAPSQPERTPLQRLCYLSKTKQNHPTPFGAFFKNLITFGASTDSIFRYTIISPSVFLPDMFYSQNVPSVNGSAGR